MVRLGSIVRPRLSLASPDIVTAALQRGMTEFAAPCASEGLDVVCDSLERHLPGRHAQRLAHDELVGLLAQPPPAPRTIDSVTVIATLEPNRLASLISPLARVLLGERRALDRLFFNMDFERRWHIPEFYEWLATADLADQYRALIHNFGQTVLCATQHLERLTIIAESVPHLRILIVRSASLDDVARRYARAYVAERVRWESPAAPEQIGKYVRWRLEELLARRNEQLAVVNRLSHVEVERVSLAEIESDPSTRQLAIEWLLGDPY
jgi:hypothetical protein